MTQSQKTRSFDDLTREEVAFLESQTGFDTLKGYIKDYDRNLMAHYAKGRSDLGDVKRITEMATIANDLTQEGGINITNLNSRVNIAYNKYQDLSDNEKSQITASAYVLMTLPDVEDSEVEKHSTSINEATDRTRRIFEYLRDTGRDFKVEPDENFGQIRAVLTDDTKMQVRAMDAGRADMIGRTHRNGKSYYYQYANSDLGNSDVALYVPNEFVTKQMEYALGESVQRYVQRSNPNGTKSYAVEPNLPKVGMQSMITGRNYVDSYVSKGSGTDSYSAAIISADSQIDFTARTGRQAGRQLLAYPDIRILVNGRRSAYGENFTVYDNEYEQTGITEADKTKEYLANARRSAKDNFVEILGAGSYDTETGVYDFSNNNALDYIARAKTSGDTAADFALSERPQVAELQSAYLKTRGNILAGGNLAFCPDDDVRQYFYEFLDEVKKSSLTNDDMQAFLCSRHDEEFAKKIESVFGGETENSDKHLGSFHGPNIAAYMTSNHTFIINEKDMQKALKLINEDYELLGDDFDAVRFNDGTIKFNPETAQTLTPGTPEYEELSEFWQRIADTTNTTLLESGVMNTELQVDNNGIIQYTGTIHSGMRQSSGKQIPVSGTIGQIFEPINEPYKSDGSPNPKHGLIPTAYKGTENGYIAAGYTAYILDKTGEHENESVEQRTRCRGYEQLMQNRIKSTIRDTIVGDMGAAGTKFDKSTDLNYVYRHLYAAQLSFDFEEQMTALGRDDETINALVKTQLSRVRYDSNYGDETSILAKQKAEKQIEGYNTFNSAMDGEPLAILKAETSAGFFDDVATSTAKNQGLTRYLVVGAEVLPDGSVTQGRNTDDTLATQTYITQTSDFRYIHESPPDRAVMSLSNAFNQSSVARGHIQKSDGSLLGVGTAHMTLGGLTQDDGFVISKEFAEDEKNKIVGKNGKLRPLKLGDKICDHSGNKGVISLVVNRNADLDSPDSYYKLKEIPEDANPSMVRRINKENQAKSRHREIIELFKDNPCLDVVGAPYTSVSRFNGGCAREMIESQAEAEAAEAQTALKIRGKEIPGGIGYANFIVTDMPVDEKTKIYEDEGGRNASSQLIAAIAAAGADKLAKEMFQYHTAGITKVREFAIVMGCDVTQTGQLKVGYESQVIGYDENDAAIHEQRNVLDVEAFVEQSMQETGKFPNRSAIRQKFNETLCENGGFMKLPFEVELASGQRTDMLPVLSAKYRTGRDVIDGSQQVHDFTRFYDNIYNTAIKYTDAKRIVVHPSNAKDEYMLISKAKTPETREKAWNNKLEESMKTLDTSPAEAQGVYSALSRKIEGKFFSGKRNMFKMDVMRAELKNSASAVISADPMLDFYEVRIPKEMAEKLNVDTSDPNASLVIWRDPVLSDGGIRCVRVETVETRPNYDGYHPDNPWNDLVGLQMNPVAAKSYEADFDGDNVGIYNPTSPAAIADARKKLGYGNNMLNLETIIKNPQTNEVSHELYLNLTLDVARACYDNPEIKTKFDEITKTLNEIHGEPLTGESIKRRSQAMLELSDNVREAYDTAFGCDVIRYDSVESHIESIKPMIEAGAKGSYGKLQDYCKYLGVHVEPVRNKDGETVDVKFISDAGKSLATEEDRAASFSATHAKSVLTGLAGVSLQKALVQAKNMPVDNANGEYSRAAAAMALTHPVTQRVLQLKHDSPAEVIRTIDLVQNVNQGLWAGNKIEEIKTETGSLSFGIVKDEATNKPVQATPEEWVAQVEKFYSSKHGLNVGTPNPEYIRQMAETMTVTDLSGRRVIQGYDNFMYNDPDKNGHCPNSYPLDDMAYFGNFKKFAKYCEEGASLYSGSVNETLMPRIIRENIKEVAIAAADTEVIPELRSFGAKDTRSQQIELSENPCLTVDDVTNCLRNNIEVSYENKVELEDRRTAAIVESPTVEQPVNVSANPYYNLPENVKADKMQDIAFHFCRDSADFKGSLHHLYQNNPELYEYYTYLADENCPADDRALWLATNTEARNAFDKILKNTPATQTMTASASASAAVGEVNKNTENSDYSMRFE